MWFAIGTIGDCSDEKVLADLVERLCSSLAEDLAADGVCAKQVVVKVKRSDFTVKQHSFTLPSPVCCAAELSPVAVRLLHKEMPATVRLVGVKVMQLNAASGCGGGVNVSSGILQKAMQTADAAAVTVCPICLKVIAGEPPNVSTRTVAPVLRAFDSMHVQVHANRCLSALPSSAMRTMLPPAAAVAQPVTDDVTVITDSSEDEQSATEPHKPQQHLRVIDVEDSPPRSACQKRSSHSLPPSKIEHFFKKCVNK